MRIFLKTTIGPMSAGFCALIYLCPSAPSSPG